MVVNQPTISQTRATYVIDETSPTLDEDQLRPIVIIWFVAHRKGFGNSNVVVGSCYSYFPEANTITLLKSKLKFDFL